MTLPPRRRLRLKTLPEAVYAVGDVHGCRREYEALEAAIIADARQGAPDRPILIVLVGDIVDRGPDSAGMIDLVSGPAPTGVQRLCLAGNHEEMMLKWLQAPNREAGWLGYGGRETLQSYGIEASHLDPSRRRLAHQVAATIPQEHLDFLASLPVSLSLPGYLVTHAGIAPDTPFDETSDHVLMWGRPAAIDDDPPADICVVHGHVPAPEPVDLPHRICVDTGAFGTGVLTAARLLRDRNRHFLRYSARR